MKLHLPLFLKAWLMLAVIAVAHAESTSVPLSALEGNISLGGEYGDAFSYLDESGDSSVITLAEDVSFTQADREERAFTSSGQLNFIGTSSQKLSFDHNTTSSGFGGCISANSVVFEKLGGLSFTNNKSVSDEWSDGGAISAGSVEISGVEGNILFQNNRVEGAHVRGGAVSVEGNGGGEETSLLKGGRAEPEADFSMIGNKGTIIFDNNSAVVAIDEEDGPDSTEAYGGAVYVYGSFEMKDNAGDISFTNNKIESCWHGEGGAVSVEEGSVLFSGNKGTITFSHNGISLSRPYTDGEMRANGGSVDVEEDFLMLDNEKDILFSENYISAIPGVDNDEREYDYQSRLCGGAVNTQSMLEMSGNKAQITFSGNSILVSLLSVTQDIDSDYYIYGGAISANENVEIHHNLGRITFSGNTLTFLYDKERGNVYSDDIELMGGAVHTDGSFMMGWNGEDILFSGNGIICEAAAVVSGGAVHAGNGIVLSGNKGDVRFEKNFIVGGMARGGAIGADGRENGGGGEPSFLSAVFPEETQVKGILISGNKKRVIFTGNRAEGTVALGGAIAVNGDLVMDGNVGDIIFSGNRVVGGMDYDNSQPRDIEPNGVALGGAVYSVGMVTISGNEGNVLFEGNIADGSNRAAGVLGGAIYSESGVSITGNKGDVRFTGNQVMGGLIDNLGGAIASGGDVLLGADRGDIYFNGNRMGDQSNAIFMFSGNDSATLTMRAAEGHKVVFNDGIQFSSDSFSIRLNEGAEGGDIIFSGSDAVVDLGTNRYEYNNRIETILGGGALILEKGAIYGAGSNPGVFRVTGEAVVRVVGTDTELRTEDLTCSRQGTLDMSGGTVIADNSISLHLAQVLISNGGRMEANHINMHGGLIYDLKSTTHLVVSPLLSFALDGNLTIRDHGLDIYRTKDFAQDKEILVMHNGGILHTGSLGEILSETSNSYKVGDSTTSQGYWTMEWRNDNKDLYAIWTVENALPNPIDPELPVFITVAPEHAGNLVPNTLWSTVSNVNALGAAAMGQVGVARFTLQKDSNYWVTGLGDFSRHNTVGLTDGYDYTGGGYAVGADTKLGKNFVGGVAFGQLFGTNKSHGYNAEVDQKSYIGMVYGAWRSQIDQVNALNVQGSASYGYTDNTLDTRYSTGEASRGSWDNNAYQATLQGSWDRALNANWTLSPYIGVEYTDAEQKAFAESGDISRRFGTSHMRNLSLPVGVGVTRLDTYGNGIKWVNALTVSYVPDVYRENPESTVYRSFDNGTWTAKGISPARNAGRLEFNTRVIWTENWSTFAGYELEGRSHAVYQRVNLGVSASF